MNLDRLLAEALREDYLAKKAKAPKLPTQRVPRYAPSTWTPARQIELIWSDTPASSEKSSLGTFREMVHSSSGGRRLARMDAPSESEELFFEFCYGESWVGARTPLEIPLGEEIYELRSRYEELMRGFEEKERSV